MRLGELEVHSVIDGFFALDGGAMFGVVPRVMWQKKHAPDENNRIRLALRTLLVRGQGRVLLVDTGIGDKWADKLRQQFCFEPGTPGLEKALSIHGLTKDDVTDVVVTHLHFDHAGGATETRPDGTLAPAFPNATFHIQRANWDWASHPNDREKASYLKENFEPLRAAGRVNLLEGPTDLWPGVSVLVSNGHTRGQQLVKVTGGDRTVLFPGDLVPTASHLRTAWTMAYDIEPVTLMQEKTELLAQAERGGWVVCFEHDAEVEAGTVRAVAGGFELAEVVSL